MVLRCGRADTSIVMVWRLRRCATCMPHALMPLRRHFERVSAPVNFNQSINPRPKSAGVPVRSTHCNMVSSNKFYYTYGSILTIKSN